MKLNALQRRKFKPTLQLRKKYHVMRTLCLLILLILFESSDTLFGQSISLDMRNASPVAIIKAIEQQSTYRFVYTKEQLARQGNVTIKVKNVTIEKALANSFDKELIEWNIEGNLVILRLAKQPILRRATTVELTKLLKGVVVNSHGEGIAGVTIQQDDGIVKGTTDEKGYYVLNVEEGMDLYYSCVGYETVSFSWDAVPAVLEMKERTRLLEEAVVIAYGSTTRKLNTGSVGTIKAATIEQQPVNNPLAALQGRVPGLQITQESGLPGSGFSVLIRGRNSIENGTTPLVIVDGVPFFDPSEQLMQRGSFSANSPFATINPKDIASIEILKDADATSIYGSRGANGVILITTKQASKKGSRVSLRLYNSFGREARVMNFMNVHEYLQMRREAFANDSLQMTNQNAPDVLLWDSNATVNWKKKLMGETARQFNASLSYETGNEQVQFAMRSNYNQQTSLFPGEFGSKGGNVNLSGSYRARNGKLFVEFGTGYAYQKSLLPLKNMGVWINLPPHAMALYDSSGGYNWTGSGVDIYGNPLALLEQTHTGITQRVSLTHRLEYRLIKGFHIGYTAGLNSMWFDETTKIPILSQKPDLNTTGDASFGNNATQNWSIEPQAGFDLQNGRKGKLSVLTGLSLQASNTKSSTISGSGYSNDLLLESISGAAIRNAENDKSQYRYKGVFMRINYQYDERYLINLTGRRDGSSRFGPDKRHAHFGAVGAAWIFTKENFLQKQKILTFGKLRGSFGVTGNDQIKNYQYLDSWLNGYYGYLGNATIQPNKLFNSDYSWEQIRKKEIAIELGFLRNHIFLTASYYNAKSDNQIVNYPLPSQTGYGTILRNFPGVVQNSGLEILLETVNYKNQDIKWTSSFNMSIPTNRLAEFPLLEQSSYANSLRIGKSLNSVVGYVYTGVDAATGEYGFKDLNGDGEIDNNDREWVGSTDPKFYGGFSNNLQWKNITIDFLFEFRKQDGLNPILAAGGLVGRMMNMPRFVMERWRPGVSDAVYERFSQQNNGGAAKALAYLTESGGILTDASFVRLKNLFIGYDFRMPCMRKAGIDKMQVYIEGQNLLTFTRYAGADPENQSIGGTSPLRIIAMGIHANF